MAQKIATTESAALLAYLNSQREHVLGIVEGLDEEALRRPVLPSGWTCLGLIQHLTLDVERFWFHCVVAGEQDAIAALEEISTAWQVAADVPAGDVFDRYRREIAQANAIIAATPPDNAPAWWPPEASGGWRLDSIRQVILHVIAETACHAGHLDVVRELIDGRLWMIMT